MIPSSFEESNCVLDKPDDMDVGQCAPLSVLRCATEEGQPIVLSCWKPTKDELAEINKTKRVWLVILGETMPPAFVSGQKPFARAQPGEADE